MNIKIDHDEFEKRQTALIELIAVDVKSRLENMGLGDDQSWSRVWFSTSARFWTAAGRQKWMAGSCDPSSLLPMTEREHLVAADGGSWMHEICGEVVEKIYGNEPSA